MTNTQNELAALVASGCASVDQMADLGSERVALVKTNPEVIQLRAKAQKPISINDENRTISYLVSDETVDRMGDIIRVKGWNLASYRQNPVVLWGHEGKSVPPIGKANNVRRRYGPARLTADIEFAPKEAFEFADTIYQLAVRGFVRATSVGFLPTASEEVDEKKREKLGLGPFGQLYTGAELMEISVVAVPANPSALQDGVKALSLEGLMDDGTAARFFDTYPASEDLALRRVRAACRSFVDFGAGAARAVVDLGEDPGSPDIAGAAEAATEPEQAKEAKGGESLDAAQEVCGEIEHDSEVRLVAAMASLIEQQAEQTMATRQLVDGLTDLTRTLQRTACGGANGGSVSEPDAEVPEAAERSAEKIDELVNSALRGFAERIGGNTYPKDTDPKRA